jgi:outer membrane cobalamin receptor
MQGPFNYSLTDGLFTQNVARSTNLMLGFQRNVTDGRFTNSAYDSWQLRSRLRYNYSDRLNIALSDFYSTAKNGMNGGLDQSGGSSFADELTAVVRSIDAYEKYSRHDLSLLGVGKLFSDSTTTTRFHAFYSDISREYSDPGENSLTRDITEHHHSSIMGADLAHHLQGNLIYATFGVSYEQLRVIESPAVGDRTVSRSGLFGTATMPLFDILRPTVSFREERNGDASALSLGIAVRLELLSSLLVFGDFSSNHRFLSLFERSWSDSTVVRPVLPSTERHDNLEVGFEFSENGNLRTSMSAFHWVVSDAIVFQPGQNSPVSVSISSVPSVTIRGLTGTFAAQLWKLELLSSWMYTDQWYGSQAKSLFPRWSATGELAYRNIVLNGAMDLRVGGRWRFATQHLGVQFIPRPSVFVENPNNGPRGFSALDLFLVAQLGEAYLTLSWENLLNINYLLVQNYPMPGSGLKLGVNWSFID